MIAIGDDLIPLSEFENMIDASSRIVKFRGMPARVKNDMHVNSCSETIRALLFLEQISLLLSLLGTAEFCTPPQTPIRAYSCQ